MTVAPGEVVTTKGEAVGRLRGFSHIVMVCRDMDATVRFYRDVLGLKVVATSGEAANKRRDAQDATLLGAAARVRPFTRQYFFELPNGEAFGFYEMQKSVDARETAPLAYNYWPAGADGPARPHKLDHLAFQVDTRADVDWLMNRLTEHGIEVTGPFMPREGSPTQFTYRIYFWDPSGNPIEVAVHESEDDASIYLLDTEPVPALVED